MGGQYQAARQSWKLHTSYTDENMAGLSQDLSGRIKQEAKENLKQNVIYIKFKNTSLQNGKIYFTTDINK